MREPPGRHAGAQHEQAHLRQYHPCNRERIHTSSNDRYRGGLVTILLMTQETTRDRKEKIVTGQSACRSLREEAKEYFAETK